MAVNRSGPPCPECGSLVTDVNRTARTSTGDFWRRRDCPSCGHRFQTVQPAELIAPKGSVGWEYRTAVIHWAKFRSHFATLISR